MTGRRGSQESMVRTMLDRETADRLLSGHVHPDDAPPGYGEVGRLLLALGAPPTPAELRGEDDAVAAAARRLTAAPIPPLPRPTRSRPRRAKVLALAVLGSTLATSGLAAAGVLPDPAQDVVSTVLDKVGIRVPRGNGGPPADRPTPPGGGEPGEGAPGRDGTAPGLLDRRHPLRTDQRPDEKDRPLITPPAFEPNRSGTGRANEASEGKSERGTTIADDRSDGRSSAGANNADGHRNEHASERGGGRPSGNGNGGTPGAGNASRRENGPPPRGERGGPTRSHRP